MQSRTALAGRAKNSCTLRIPGFPKSLFLLWYTALAQGWEWFLTATWGRYSKHPPPTDFPSRTLPTVEKPLHKPCGSPGGFIVQHMLQISLGKRTPAVLAAAGTAKGSWMLQVPTSDPSVSSSNLGKRTCKEVQANFPTTLLLQAKLVSDLGTWLTLVPGWCRSLAISIFSKIKMKLGGEKWKSFEEIQISPRLGQRICALEAFSDSSA